MPSFKSINRSSLPLKKHDRSNFNTTPCQQLLGQNTSVRIGIIELVGPSDTLDYKLHFLNIAFYCLYLCGTKYFVLKAELYFIFF